MTYRLLLQRLCTLLLGAFFAATVCAAADTDTKKTYDLPAGDAAETLKHFAEVSGRETLFAADSVSGVTTRALSGDYLPVEALREMLRGTDLMLVADPESDALAVRRKSDPNVARTAPQTSDRPKNDPKIENGALVLERFEVTEARIDGVINRGLLQAGDNAPLYHDVVTRAEIERMGVSSLEELFRYLPQTSSISTSLQAAGSNTNTSGGLSPSYSTIGLRGFSSAQTVMLVNGRPMPRTGLTDNGGADLSRIPLAAIERVEILPSSGSAIYGGGALGGAINIILRKEYAGRDLTAYIGTSTEGGATEHRFTYLEGKGFNEGRTNLTYTLSYHHRDGLRSEDRGYLDEALRRYGPNSTLTNAQGVSYFEQMILPAFAGAPGTILVGNSTGDLGIPGAAGARYAAIPAGTSPADSFTLTPDDFAATAGVANLQPRNGRTIIYQPTESISLNAILEHEFVPERLEGYAEFTLGRTENGYAAPQSLRINLTATDPLNPFRTDVTPGFVGRPIAVFIDVPDLPDPEYDARYDSARLVAGLKGQITETWEWSVDGTIDYTDNNLNSLNPESNLTTLNQLTPFSDPGPAAPAATRRQVYPILADHAQYPISEVTVADYFGYNRNSFSNGTQKEGNARLLGEVFRLPAGPLRASILGKYTDWTYESGQSLIYSDGYYQAINGEPFSPSPSSSEASREGIYGAIELSAPIFGRDWHPIPFISGWEIQASFSREENTTEGVNFNGDAFTNEQSANSNVIATKIQFTPDIAIRGSYSEGFYPPNWSDVSAPESQFSLPGFFPDPARGNTMQFTPMMAITQGGNPGLEPELAESYNLGLIFTPRALPDFSLNLDFWRIEKTDAIFYSSFVSVIANPDAFGFLITREDPTPDEAAMGWLGRITAVDARAFNASITRTEGADIRLRYRMDADELGDFTFNATATFTNSFELLATPTAPIIEQVGSAGPVHWRGNAAFTWERNRWSATVTARYVDSRFGPTTDPSPSFPGAYPIDGHMLPSILTADLQVSYEQSYSTDTRNWFQGTKWTLGVLNVTNKEPSFVTDGTSFYDRAADPRQRFVYVQIKKSL
ncbi:TonB-dependent receptor [Synoicihabitans lomoniglobus]|uniref:TonB-dependent receptor n=1 Tax=Synoicihabitans lomoniglobus TaxID=2909285 RepID=A0AAE9ZVT0_9BACT|nr:TonB-dependent receptor [Opitutaceae bacterium LMO-M01]WED64316.1 TonB-dependent receptor [Opitutaceae bacterium LMO-M01]